MGEKKSNQLDGLLVKSYNVGLFIIIQSYKTLKDEENFSCDFFLYIFNLFYKLDGARYIE